MKVMGDIAISSGGYGAVYASRAGVGVGATPEADATRVAPARPDPTKGLTSPVGVVDPASGVYVLQFRDSKTGEVEVQYPSAKVVNAYRQGLIENTSSPEVSARPRPSEGASAAPSEGASTGQGVGQGVGQSTGQGAGTQGGTALGGTGSPAGQGGTGQAATVSGPGASGTLSGGTGGAATLAGAFGPTDTIA